MVASSSKFLLIIVRSNLAGICWFILSQNVWEFCLSFLYLSNFKPILTDDFHKRSSDNNSPPVLSSVLVFIIRLFIDFTSVVMDDFYWRLSDCKFPCTFLSINFLLLILMNCFSIISDPNRCQILNRTNDLPNLHLLLSFYSLRVFPIRVSSSFTGVWVRASLPCSPGLFSVF